MPEWTHERIRREYMEVPAADRLMAARSSLARLEAKVKRLEAEFNAGGSTAWLARRQLPGQRRLRDATRLEIEALERELECSDDGRQAGRTTE